MIALTLAEAAAAVGGTLDGADPEAVVTGPVVVDSRQVQPGGLFVAVVGEHVDGHDYAAKAVGAGAVAVLASRQVGVPAILVDDVVVALGRLARAVVERATGTAVVALTGSSGKTSTKDLIAQVLQRHGETVYPPGNLNNEIGHPMTALRVEAATRHLVLEMGARHKGDIEYLTGITPPSIAIVLNVGSAHVGEFGSKEGIAEAKGEIVEALGADGVAVLNADDPLVRAMASRTKGRVVLFGESRAADVRAADVRLDDTGRPSFTLITPAGSAPVNLRLYGEHHVSNALAAAAVAVELGMPVDDTAEALSQAGALSRWRMEVVDRADGVTVVNDAYNANPDSMRAALRALVSMAGRGPGRRRTFAVLGEMRELGEDSLDEHDAIGRLAVRLDVTKLVAVGGREAACMELGARNEGSWGEESVLVSDADAAIELLRSQLQPGDVVLVKASRSAGLEKVAEALLADGAAQ
ncbi:UDP-N-acetylmuramoyl-tripeptide--D-alanyl-D-alanine ligase [Kitasatospora sp. NPDC085879]|uniref:UDP-N-acetylmuramoyl-tripeptide--D-alanyl-D- alanine ligase n=1 Tax=Kitasatospora sp. NPDC085879 TaxID=3154769 RepID=UPI000BB0D7BA|nr:UDP-N-acetylmuramoyl-tripeptide--D-alanyl-D-alanine ligase [Streptomyces sp. TLI_235]PBC71997.1 UDP-N-acetylmuramoyl-tripeptide--D-alanyl-D-alanine ligase [Streptomyces sp. TLI_235]